MALGTLAVKGEAHGAAVPAEVRSFVDDMVDTFALASAFTPEEQAFIDSDAPDDIDRIQFTWRYDCYWVLLWALGFVETLGRPSSMCDPAIAMRILRDLGRDQFMANAELRPPGDWLDEADLAYRYHWAVVDARLRGEVVEGLDAGVVMERHYALNWLIGYGDQDWDDITTDT